MREKYFEIKTGNEPEDDRVVKISKIENKIAELEDSKPDNWRKDAVELKRQLKIIEEKDSKYEKLPNQSEADISEDGGLLENQSENAKEILEDSTREKMEKMKLFLEELKKTDFSSLSLEELKEKTEKIKIFRGEVRITNITDDNLKKEVGDLKNELSEFDVKINFKIGEINESNRQSKKVSKESQDRIEGNQDNSESFESENFDSKEDVQPSKRDQIADKKLRKDNFSTSEEVKAGLKRKKRVQKEISLKGEERTKDRDEARIKKRQEDPVENWKDEVLDEENIDEENITEEKTISKKDIIDEIPVIKNEEDLVEMSFDELDNEIKRVNKYLLEIKEERGIDNEDFTEQSMYLALLISAKEELRNGEIVEPETSAVIETLPLTNAEAIERLERMDVFIELAKDRLVNTEERLSEVEESDIATLADKTAVRGLTSADLLGTELSKLYLIDPENMTEDQLRKLRLAKAEKITELKENLELGVRAMQMKLADAQAEKTSVETRILEEKKKGFVAKLKNLFPSGGVVENSNERAVEIPANVVSSESEEATPDFGYLNGIGNLDDFERMTPKMKKQLNERAGRWPGGSKTRSKEIIKTVGELPSAIRADDFNEKKDKLLNFIREHREELKDKKVKKEKFVKYANAVLDMMEELLGREGKKEVVEESLDNDLSQNEFENGKKVDESLLGRLVVSAINDTVSGNAENIKNNLKEIAEDTEGVKIISSESEKEGGKDQQGNSESIGDNMKKEKEDSEKIVDFFGDLTDDRIIDQVRTEKGSVYTYLEDGTTQRYKEVTGETDEPQDAIVYIPDFEWIKKSASKEMLTEIGGNTEYGEFEFERNLLSYIHDKGKRVVIKGKDEKLLRNNKEISDYKDQIYLGFADNGKIKFHIPVSRKPRIGFNTFDTRTFKKDGVDWHEKHIGNKVTGIKTKEPDNETSENQSEGKEDFDLKGEIVKALNSRDRSDKDSVVKTIDKNSEKISIFLETMESEIKNANRMEDLHRILVSGFDISQQVGLKDEDKLVYEMLKGSSFSEIRKAFGKRISEIKSPMNTQFIDSINLHFILEDELTTDKVKIVEILKRG
ncbi:MAG: hypothetical protein KAI57_03990 [Candidatus Pacebacteria bacterium]|nr:hypothetical protein [Candidatus Paceibacterota bacterium]